MRNKAKTNNLSDLKKKAFSLMEKAGFPVENVAVVLDEDLPYMGHTTEIDGVPVVVVSGMALQSGIGINLLIHELSHVYRTQTAHPSHNAELIFSITSWVMRTKAVDNFQEEIIFSIINHLQDLYADDIFFKVFDKDQGIKNINEFFLGWIQSPIEKVKTHEDSWLNASNMLSAAFVQANLHRHNIKDDKGVIAKELLFFLSKIDKRQASKYEFFKNLMVSLPEKPTAKEYEKILIRYLDEFLKIANIN